MSINQLTGDSQKKWMVAKTFDLTVDGTIKISNDNSREGDILSCTSVNVAEFVPLSVTPNLTYNYYYLSSNGNQVITSFFSYASAPGYSNPNFTITNPSTLTCNTTGTYLVMKKITRNIPNNGGVRSDTLLNNVIYPYGALAMQQTTGGVQGAGLSNGYLLKLTSGDTIRESFTIYGTSFQDDQLENSCNIQLIKIA